MADTVPPKVRSRMMSRIRSTDTSPERVVRSYLHRHGLRFRKHPATLAGKPDVVLPRYRTAVFVHGCFWHQHQGCREGRIPDSNRDYWEPKLTRTVERDRQHRAQLEADGWRVFIVWECELTCSKLNRLRQAITRPHQRSRRA